MSEWIWSEKIVILFMLYPVHCLFCSSWVHALYTTIDQTKSSFRDCNIQHILSCDFFYSFVSHFFLSRYIQQSSKTIVVNSFHAAFPICFCQGPCFCTVNRRANMTNSYTGSQILTGNSRVFCHQVQHNLSKAWENNFLKSLELESLRWICLFTFWPILRHGSVLLGWPLLATDSGVTSHSWHAQEIKQEITDQFH